MGFKHHLDSMAPSCSPSRAGQAAGDAGKGDLPGEQAGEAESDIKGTQLVGLVRVGPATTARPAPRQVLPRTSNAHEPPLPVGKLSSTRVNNASAHQLDRASPSHLNPGSAAIFNYHRPAQGLPA